MSRRLLVAAVFAASPLAALPASGGPDPSFGGDGTVETAVAGRDSSAFALALQSDGRIVAAGEAGGDFALARYRGNGRLDTTFGDGGVVTTDLGGVDAARAITLTSGGRIVVAGVADGDFAVARYERDGRLDQTFGGDGTVVTDLGARDSAWGVLLGEGDAVVAVGVSSPAAREGAFALVRYRGDGSVDARFGAAGRVLTPLRAVAAVDAALAPGGRIVVSGFRVVSGPGEELRIEFLVARYLTDGTLDRAFGAEGVAAVPAPPHWLGGDEVAVQPDGKILVAAHGHTARLEAGVHQWGHALLRFRANGSLDPTFAEAGYAVTAVGVGASAVAVAPRGRIVVAGATFEPSRFFVARYTPEGKLDRRFGRGGWTSVRLSGARPWDAVVQRDGRVVVTGASGEPRRFAVARFLPPRCVVPDLRGYTLRSARTALERAGCTLGRARGPAAGRVARQQPSPGARLPEDTRVQIVFTSRAP